MPRDVAGLARHLYDFNGSLDGWDASEAEDAWLDDPGVRAFWEAQAARALSYIDSD